MLERGLLFGILSLQNDFVEREQFFKAFSQCLRTGTSLDVVLQENGFIPINDCELLNKLVDRYLLKFGGDAAQALSQLSSVGSIRGELSAFADSQLPATHSIPWLSAILDETVLHGAPSAQPQSRGPTSEHRFHILRKHAEGGLGVVFVANDQQLRREVALKQIREDRADDELYRQRFSQEAEITGQLEHPGIVPIYALGTDEMGRPYYAMRFIRGQSLKDEIRKFHQEVNLGNSSYNGPELRRLVGRFIDVCDAIEYAHDRGVLHRDLKPGNVMLGKYGETLVVDWGLAKPLGHALQAGKLNQSELPVEPSGSDSGSETRYGQFLGTASYAPPEQLQGKLDELSPASDVYSLGAILYELLTGFPPISNAKTIDEALEEIKTLQSNSPRRLNSAIPQPLAEICRKAMRLERNERFPSARDLRDDVQRWLDDRSVTAYREPARAALLRWTRRHQAATATIAVGMLATISLISAYRIFQEKALADKASYAQAEAQLKLEANAQQAKADAAAFQSLADKAYAARNRGNIPEAIGHLRDLQLAGGNLSVDQSLLLSRLLFLNQQTTDAYQSIRSIDLSGASVNQTATHNLLLGDLLFGTTAGVEGEQLLNAAIESGGLSTSDMAYALGLLAKTPSDCVKQLEACLRLDPFHSMARLRLGLTLVIIGRPQSAIALAEAGLQFDHQDWRLQSLIALAHASAGRSEQMTTSLRKVEAVEEAQNFSRICRLTAKLAETLESGLDFSKRPNVFATIGKFTKVIAEAGQVLGELTAKTSIDDQPLSTIPKLGWFASVYEVIDAPTLNAPGLTAWLTTALLQSKSDDYVARLVEVFPDSRLMLTYHVGLDNAASAESQLAICERALKAESSIQSLDVALMMLSSLALGIREGQVKKGTLSRGEQIDSVGRWTPFFQQTAGAYAFDPSQEQYLALVWGLLAMNGFTSLATEIAERESNRDVDEETRQRWQDRAALSLESSGKFNQLSISITTDPRYILVPKKK